MTQSGYPHPSAPQIVLGRLKITYSFGRISRGFDEIPVLNQIDWRDALIPSGQLSLRTIMACEIADK
jgi:hypothetical protein